MTKERLSAYVTLICTLTLSFIILSMVGVMLVGLFVDKIDNAKIFEIIGPSFQGIVGGMIGLVAGIKIGTNQD